MKNRDFIIQEFSEHLVEGMDWDTLRAFVVDALTAAHRQLDDNALEDKIREFAPHLLD